MCPLIQSSIGIDKRVLVTGHTGFKGAWLTTWLVMLGAKVLGISKNLPTKPSFYKELKISKNITDLRFDIKDLNKLNTAVINPCDSRITIENTLH